MNEREEPFHVPFVLPGFSEATDPTVLETGRMRSVANGRWRAGGGVSKAAGFQSAGTTVTSGSTALSSSTVPQVIAEYRGNRVLGAGGLLYSTLAAGGTWTEGDRIGQFTPRRIDPVFRDDVTGPISSPSIAYMSGYVCAACSDSSAIVRWVVTDEGGNVLRRGTISTASSGGMPRVVTVGSNFVLVYKDSTSLKAIKITPSTLTVSSASTIGTLNAAGDYFDAAAWNDFQFLVAYRATATTTQVHRFVASTMVSGASQTCTHANDTVVMSVLGFENENVYLAFLEPLFANVRVEVYNAALSAVTGALATVELLSGNDGQPVMARESSSSVRLCWGGADSSNTWFRHCTVSNAAVAGTITNHYGAMPISRPYNVTAATSFRCWAVMGTNGTEAIRGISARYVLLSFISDGGTYYAHPELWGDAGLGTRTSENRVLRHLSEVITTASDYVMPLCDIVRSDSSISTGFGINLYRYYAATLSARHAHRAGIEAAGALHITGGVMIEHLGGSGAADQAAGIENGFLNPPLIVSSSAVAGGSLTAGATYQYYAVLEYLDTAGRRGRSAPSNAVTVSPSGGNLTGRLGIQVPAIGGRLLKDGAYLAVHVYRTQANGSVFRRVTSDVTAPSGDGTASGGITYNDTQADTAIADEEVIYTAGGVYGNYPAPSHRFGVLGAGRMWVGGLFRENEVALSKEIVPEEPAQFVESPQWRLLLPEANTGLGFIDDTVVLFTERGIYTQFGDGPDDRGQGAFGEPRKLPTANGCTDWRTVQEVPAGLLYQGARGFFLLPRGFGAPVFQAEIQDTIRQYPICFGVARSFDDSVSSGVLGENSLVFLMGDNETPSNVRAVVYDLDSGAWTSVDTFEAAYALAGTWGGRVALANTAMTTLHVETPSFWTAPSSYRAMRVRTGALRPFGFGGFGYVRRVQFIGQIKGDLPSLNVVARIDGKTAQQTMTATALTGLATGENWYVEWKLPIQRCNAIDFEIWDSVSGASTDSSGFVLHGVVLWAEPTVGGKRLGAATRA